MRIEIIHKIKGSKREGIGVSNLTVEIIHKLVRGMATLEEYTRGVQFLGVESFLKTASQRATTTSSARIQT